MSARRDAAAGAAGWMALALIGLVVAVLVVTAIAAGVGIGWVVSEIAKAFR